MVICVTVDFKSDARQGKDLIFMNFQGRKIWNNDGSLK